MTVKPLGNGEYSGFSTDTKPTPASTAVSAMFEETDTGNRYKNSGTAWALLRTGDLTNDYDFLIYPLGALDYRVKRGSDGRTVYTSSNASLQDANGAMSYCRDNLPSTTYGSIVKFNPGLYTLQSGFSVVHDVARFSTWTGPTTGLNQSAQIKPNGLFGCFVCTGDAGTGLTGITIKNLCFTHSRGASNATTPFIRFQNMCRETLI